MSSSAPPESAVAEPVAASLRVHACLQHIAHLLPAQAPLRDFVHHNTLHALQHLPFVDALGEAARLTGARPWLDEERCRALFRQGRVDVSDLTAALRQLPAARVDEVLCAGTTFALSRGDVLQATLLYPPPAISAAAWRWQIEEKAAGERLQADLDPRVGQGRHRRRCRVRAAALPGNARGLAAARRLNWSHAGDLGSPPAGEGGTRATLRV